PFGLIAFGAAEPIASWNAAWNLGRAREIIHIAKGSAPIERMLHQG
ncbi:MAG: hypothetical protein F6K55_35090, partial [Moorea sp. SIO4A3]|nr:hypothetical protein [Moorena sp. SIO4A3]